MLLLSILSTSEIINALLLGGILGMVGQGIRATIGIKKLRETNADPNLPTYKFEIDRFVATLLLGFLAGLLATIPFFNKDFSEGPKWNQEIFLTLIAAGYSGVDFIEGFLKGYLTKKNINQ